MPRSITHASFTITRHWKHAPSRVFEAFIGVDPLDGARGSLGTEADRAIRLR